MSCDIWTEQPTKARKSLQNPEEQEHCLLTARVGGWQRAPGAAAGGEVSVAEKLASGNGSLRGGARPGSVCDPAEHAGARCQALS